MATRGRSVAIFGLGYVGTVCAASLASRGHRVVGVDVSPEKVARLNGGESPVTEPGLDGLITQAVASGNLRAVGTATEAVEASELALLCVGTPSQPNGAQDQQYLRRVIREIAAGLPAERDFYGVVIRSTVLPGTAAAVLRPLLREILGENGHRRVGLGVNPEFLREGSALHDFAHPPFTLVGTDDSRLDPILRDLYGGIEAPWFTADLGTVELLKMVCNAFHALKIAFANEIGTLCSNLSIDGSELMRLFCEDRKLNVSDKYLRPGPPFGGSCLPKDLRALAYLGRTRDLALPLLDAVLASNEEHLRRAVRAVEATGLRKVGLLGLTFKPGTDDLRESPAVDLAQTLLGRGYDLTIYDPSLSLPELVGANKRFIDERLPHLARLLRADAGSVVASSEVVVVSYESPDFLEALEGLDPGRVIDLTALRVAVTEPPRTPASPVA